MVQVSARKITPYASDEYRANAAECQKMARLSRHPGERDIWLRMARTGCG